MRSFFIVHEPGKVSRIGFPLDDPTRLDDAIEGWQHSNPTAEIYVVTYWGVAPTPGTVSVETARERLAISAAMKDAEFPVSQEAK